ncbi:TMEM175 family protein [Microlunatus ginsengisoli]|uniref:TMEM175 family protein n=1 Tax=Microlunatus ginsengisoli TaxID=363863 RepID=A0ABP6ZKS9_9ACTN
MSEVAARTPARSGARRYTPGRVMSFSDAVFAIAITLLVLPLTDLDLDPERLAEQLRSATPQIVVFAVGFTVIGLYWLSHHAWFSRVRTVDDRLLKINLVVLACVAFLPFPTSVLGTHSGTAGTVFYAASVAFTGTAFALMWTYLGRNPELFEADSAAALRRHTLVGLVTPVVFAASIPIALVSADGGKLCWLLIWPASTIASRLVSRTSRSSSR